MPLSHVPQWYITPEKGDNQHFQLPAQKRQLFQTEKMSHVFTIYDILVFLFKHHDSQLEFPGMVKFMLSFSSVLKD